MSNYITYENNDPTWKIDKTDYPLTVITHPYSEKSLKKFSDYYYNDCKALISIKSCDNDFLYLINQIQSNGFIEIFELPPLNFIPHIRTNKFVNCTPNGYQWDF